MKKHLVNTVDGSIACYDTLVSAEETNVTLHFCYEAKNSKYYCPYTDFNDRHYLGDVCELFIGTRTEYYEIEVTPNGSIFFAKLCFDLSSNTRKATYLDEKTFNKYVKATASKTIDGYVVDIFVSKALFSGDIYFNAYRIETDGGTPEKYLFAFFPTGKASFHVPQSFGKFVG